MNLRKSQISNEIEKKLIQAQLQSGIIESFRRIVSIKKILNQLVIIKKL